MGLFSNMKKTRESFAQKLAAVFGAKAEINDDLYEELEDALITADVGAVCAAQITDELSQKVRKDHLKTPDEAKAALRDIIAGMLSGDNGMKLTTKPSVIMVIGVNGAGKTTTIGKLAAKYHAQGKKVIVAAADTFRAAAIEQLEVWTQRAGVAIVKQQQGSDPAAVLYDAITAATAREADILICDTAGRLHNKKDLMDELEKMGRILKTRLPDADVETLLVLDGVTGQNAVNQAREFSKTNEITGIVLTKLDGTAKGGIVIPIRAELGLPVKYIGVGEKIEDLREFDPAEFAEALL
ncbi:MAG TPA: signal recognition particle-docking protein FtsY [Oscillospiraceae bacterium]|nr:signal recognition particle-docking protein FtsY [Oscillospiraceae bacterium]HPF57091.1 signal recognition particle-docking protein FtsY [Clostridiales bacterium]HPK36525.1 signal recognition particle-docking protein FtsY [Oscillospiraceae bacterium]HPR76879.1 signal recognition particle-docking protein FtsY [Oscillospiraceae bacterium]